MTPLHTNLLPVSARRRLRQSYLLRFVVIALMLATGVVIIHGTLLVPSYLQAASAVKDAEVERTRLQAQTTTAEEQAAQAQLVSLRADIARLTQAHDLPSGSESLYGVLKVPRTGISIRGLSYTAAQTATSSAQMTVAGIAASRESLRQFVGALEDAPGVTAAELPISAYARETAIPFSITLTGAPTP